MKITLKLKKKLSTYTTWHTQETKFGPSFVPSFNKTLPADLLTDESFDAFFVESRATDLQPTHQNQNDIRVKNKIKKQPNA